MSDAGLTRYHASPSKRPRKRFGQHFLASSWANRVVAAIAPAPGDIFLEIGPGTGALTLPLAASGAPILGIEIDRDLASDLAGRVPPNVTILSGDVLEVDIVALLGGLEPSRPPQGPGTPVPTRRLRVVGNLPYYIASPILFRLVDLHKRHVAFADATVMVQKEVATRLVARPRTKDYGVLTILLTMHARIASILELPPGAFTPPPKVRSTLVRLSFGPPAAFVPDEALFEQLVKVMFGRRRKTLSNALKPFDPRSAAVLAESGLDGRRRPETLQVAEIARLAELFAVARRPPVL